MDVQSCWYTAKYEFELEAIVFAAWGDVVVKNIPIHVYYPPQAERVSHFRPFRDFTRISVLNTVLVLITCLWIIPRNLLRKLSWSNCKRFFTDNVLNTTGIQPEDCTRHHAWYFYGYCSIMGLSDADHPLSCASVQTE